MKKIYFLIILLSNYINSQSLIKTYYDPIIKTKLKEVYQVKPNTPILNGNYKLYDEYGFLLVDRNYINNIQNGKSTTYFGTAEASLQYDKAREICLGKISGTFNYKNGVLDGLQTYFDYSENAIRFTKKKETYVNGNMVGFTEYFSNGKEKKVLQIGKCYENYENGGKYAEYTTDNKGLTQGKFISWYQSGKIETVGEFLNDKQNGKWIEYNEDSTIKSSTEYDLGKRIQTSEEKILEEKRLKEEQEVKKQEEKLLNEKTKEWAKNEDIAKQKKIIEKKESELKNIEHDFEIENQLVISKYKYWEQDSYKYLKKSMFKSYEIISNHISDFLADKEILIDKKIVYAKIRLKLAMKMNSLVDKNTNDLEKQLKKTEDFEQIIKLFRIE